MARTSRTSKKSATRIGRPRKPDDERPIIVKAYLAPPVAEKLEQLEGWLREDEGFDVTHSATIGYLIVLEHARRAKARIRKQRNVSP